MYTYEIDPADMFEDRAGQFAKFGIPADEIERIRAAVKDMWADAPGGWVYEWSKLAGEHADRGDHYLSSLIYGCAKFPCLTDQARVQAMQHQLEQFQLAAQVERGLPHHDRRSSRGHLAGSVGGDLRQSPGERHDLRLLLRDAILRRLQPKLKVADSPDQ